MRLCRPDTVLIRFNVKEESEAEIRLALDLTSNQFRLIKSRAKLRYAELVQQRCSRLPMRISPHSVRDAQCVA